MSENSEESQNSQTTDQTTESTDTSTSTQTAADGATTTEETKTEEGKAPVGAPETYADFKLPEGVTLDKEALDKAVPIFKEMNLTQEQAQKLVELKAVGVKQANDAFEADKTARVSAIKADKEMGGDNYAKVEATITRALNTILPKDTEQAELTDFINRFGTSPGIARLLYRVGLRMSEDTRFETGEHREGPDQQKALEQSYPSMFPKT